MRCDGEMCPPLPSAMATARYRAERAGSQLVVLACYTRSCGACKALLSHVEALAEEAKAAQARAIFARHSLHDEFDAWSDVAVWHRVRAVPTVLFLDGGAVVRQHM
jgi:thioredoxin-like negative regulator of GroEL